MSISSSATAGGLNLCYETRMGILHHTHGAPDDTTGGRPSFACADRIAYINHDLDDTIRAGILTDAEDVPEHDPHALRRAQQREDKFHHDSTSSKTAAAAKIQMSDYMQEAVDFFHAFMYSDVYTNPIAKGEESKVDGILGSPL